MYNSWEVQLVQHTVTHTKSLQQLCHVFLELTSSITVTQQPIL